MTGARPLRALLVDPSLYTAPYDAALTEGLVAAGVQPSWAVRPTRRGDRQEIDARYVDDFFYRRDPANSNGTQPHRACKHLKAVLMLIANGRL